VDEKLRQETKGRTKLIYEGGVHLGRVVA